MQQSRIFRNSVVNEMYLFIFAFVSNVFLIRLLGPEGNGTLVKYLAVTNVLIALTSFNFENGINYFTPNYGFQSIKRIIIKIFGICLILSLIILIATSYLYPDLILAKSTTIDNQLLFIGLFIFGILALKIANAFMSGMLFFNAHRKISFKIGIIKTVIYAVSFGLIFYRVLYVDNTFLGIILYLSFIGLSAYVILKYLNKRQRNDYSTRKNLELSSFIKFTFPIYISYNILLLFQRLNFWIIDAELNTELLGIYGLAFTLSGMPFVYTTALRKPLYPMLSKGDLSTSHFSWIFRVNAGGIFIMIAPLILFAPIIIITIYGEEFSGAIYPFRILIIATLLNSIAHLFSSYNEIKGLVRLNIFSYTISLITLFFLGLWMIPNYGINGAAIAFLVSSSINAILIITLSFCFGMLPRDNYFFPSTKDFKRLLLQVE